MHISPRLKKGSARCLVRKSCGCGIAEIDANTCTLKIWCASVVQIGTRYMVCCAHLFNDVYSTLNLVRIAHLIWCVIHTIFGVENTLCTVSLVPRPQIKTEKAVWERDYCTVCYYIAFCPRLAFTHVNMYNIDTIQLQSSHEQCSKCVVLLSNVFVRYFVADIQSDCHAAPP